MRKRKKRKRKPVTRFVYLMERVSNRELKTRLQGKREIKIGVAKDSEQRNKQVDRGIPGKIIVLDQYYVERATTIEAKLHQLFSEKKFIPKNAKRGSGKTEFYRLTDSDIRLAKKILRKHANSRLLPLLKKSLIVAVITFIIILFLIN